MGDDGAEVLLEIVPSASPAVRPQCPRVHGGRATATNVKRCRARSCSRRSIQAVALAQADQGLGPGAPLPAAQRGDRRERKLRVTDRQAPLEHEPCRPTSGRGVKPLGLELQQYRGGEKFGSESRV